MSFGETTISIERIFFFIYFFFLWFQCARKQQPQLADQRQTGRLLQTKCNGSQVWKYIKQDYFLLYEKTENEPRD